MRAIKITIEKAKQTLLIGAKVPRYTPSQSAESLPELYQSLQTIEANLHHYHILLTQYHQLVNARRQLIDGADRSVNQLLAKLDLSLLRRSGLTSPASYKRLQMAASYLKRQGCPVCPPDIMHPVFQRRFKQFKWLHIGLFCRYKELIAALQQVISPASPLFPLETLRIIYSQILQFTSELNDLEELIQHRYQQQQILHQEIKARLQAIKLRTQYLKKFTSAVSNETDPFLDYFNATSIKAVYRS